MKKTAAIIVLHFLFTTLGAQVKLPALVGDNMVLQRNSTVRIWGWAEPGKEVSVTTSWNNETYHAKAQADSTWKVLVSTADAGGPYQVTVSDGDPVVLQNILLGEVWVCSGQSNMEMPLKGFIGQRVAGANETVARAGKYPDIRLFTVKRKRSEVPMDDCTGSWKVSAPEAALNFSAVAYHFGRNLNEILDVPVGLISTSWGGTYIEAWMDDENLKGFNPPETEAKYLMSTLLYNGMIMPVIPYGIAGWIWYQGESNRQNPTDYAELMSRMIGLWRNRWNRGDLPFYFVQIAPYVYSDGAEGASTALVRDQQREVLNSVPNTGMAVTMDIGDPVNIHPAEKKTVGDRLAYWALSETYGLKGIAYRSPEFNSMEVKEDGKVTVRFDYADVSGLSPWDVEFDGFELAGADRKYYPAKAVVDKTGKRNSVTVWSDEVSDPVAVRYCWGNYVVGGLFNTLGLPATSFRTDDWEVETRYK